MNKNLTEILIWLIADENCESKLHRQQLFCNIYDLLSKSKYLKLAQKEFSNERFENLHQLSCKFINQLSSQLSQPKCITNGVVLKLNDGLKSDKYDAEFEEISLIGSGSFGYVYKVKNKVDQQLYAIKKIVLNVSLSGDNSNGESSWGITAALTSASILYIQMELYPMTLRDAITKINTELNQSISEPITIVGAYIAKNLFEEILSGVDYLHTHKPIIIHRDLKPSNIYVTNNSNQCLIKIGDFGAASFHGFDDRNPFMHKLEHTIGKGTERYAAPKVFLHDKYDEKCDIYSLGKIAMDLFCIDKQKIFANDREKNNYIEGFNTINTEILRYISEMCDREPSLRHKCHIVLDAMKQWNLTCEKILLEPQFVHLSKIDKSKLIDTMSPLSDYILWKKLCQKKELEMTIDNYYHHENESGLISYRDEQINTINCIKFENIETDSNLGDDEMLKKIIEIVKHAFFIHATYKLIADHITKHVSNLDNYDKWKCNILWRKFPSINGFILSFQENFNLINWQNLKYFKMKISQQLQNDEDKSIEIHIILLKNDFTITLNRESIHCTGQNNAVIIKTEFKNELCCKIVEFVESELLSNGIDSPLLSFEKHKNGFKSRKLNKLKEIIDNEKNLNTKDLIYYITKEENIILYDKAITKIEVKFACQINGIKFCILSFKNDKNSKYSLRFWKDSEHINKLKEMSPKKDDEQQERSGLEMNEKSDNIALKIENRHCPQSLRHITFYSF